MCGIAGLFVYGEHRSAPRETLEALVAPLAHRGPDDQGVHLAGSMGLGHARLSIIDVAGGHQPIFNEDRTVAVVCNGEIYNHRELRRGLEDRGHRFATRSDSEVVAHLWEELGPRCVEKLAGMFALAVADFRRRTLLLARDRIGKKPLFISDDGRRLGFASELKSLLAAGLTGSGAGPEIDPEALDLYLSYGYVPAPWTIFRGATKLPAGHLAVVNEQGMRIERYWDLPVDPVHDLGPGADERLTGELESLLSSAVRDRLESEVPLGAFLSGGIDSGTIVSFMSEAMTAPVRTHTVGFADRETDERADAAAVARALGTDHMESEVRPDLVDVLPRIAWHLDEPFSDPSAVPTWYVSRETRRRVTVALSGDGGDELFAGYGEKYGMHLLEERLRSLVPGGVRRRLFPPLARRWPRSPRLPRALRLGGLLGNLSVDAARSYYQDRCLIPLHLQERLFGPRRFDPFSALEPHLARAPKEPLARALYLDLKTWLADDGLVKVDRMSMAHALEVRCPLLDHRIVEMAARLPARLKLAGGQTKILLRRVAEKRLPAEILSRPKRGFAPPISRWLREDLRDFSRDLLLAPDAFGRGLFERREVERLLDDHGARRLEAGWALWTLLMLEVWGREVAGKALSGINQEVPRAVAV